MLYNAFDEVKALVGESPLHYIKEAEAQPKKSDSIVTTVTKNVVLADGTYASVTSTETLGGGNSEVEKLTHLRRIISSGDILLGTVLCVAMTKMSLKAKDEMNRFTLSTALIIASIGKLAESKKGNQVGIHSDCIDRLSQCLRVLLDPSIRERLSFVYTNACHEAYSHMVSGQKKVNSKVQEEKKKALASNPDDLIQFRQLRAMSVQGGLEVDLMDADDISRAIGLDQHGQELSTLRHVYPLTGFSDPVYAEASVTVHDYDIVLEMLIINRTPNTLTNLTVELATMGDLKIVERPQSHTIGPLDERKVRANIKVSSTETGHIFGTIVFDNASNAQKTYVNLNDIQLDIMDYIHPSDCKNEDFRNMWAEFEWENKVTIFHNCTLFCHPFLSYSYRQYFYPYFYIYIFIYFLLIDSFDIFFSNFSLQVAINTNISELESFLAHIVKNTNMKCLTSPSENEMVYIPLFVSISSFILPALNIFISSIDSLLFYNSFDPLSIEIKF